MKASKAGDRLALFLMFAISGVARGQQAGTADWIDLQGRVMRQRGGTLRLYQLSISTESTQ